MCSGAVGSGCHRKLKCGGAHRAFTAPLVHAWCKLSADLPENRALGKLSLKTEYSELSI